MRHSGASDMGQSVTVNNKLYGPWDVKNTPPVRAMLGLWIWQQVSQCLKVQAARSHRPASSNTSEEIRNTNTSRALLPTLAPIEHIVLVDRNAAGVSRRDTSAGRRFTPPLRAPAKDACIACSSNICAPSCRGEMPVIRNFPFPSRRARTIARENGLLPHITGALIQRVRGVRKLPVKMELLLR